MEVMSLGVIITCLLAVLVVVLVMVLARARKPKIVIHERERVVLYAQAKQNCPACKEPLDGLPVARCKLDPTHVIHAMCREFVKGKCPDCNGQIE